MASLLSGCRSPTRALKIAYSDWPGWVAWEIGVQKRWFEEAGVAVEFVWFDYAESIGAFSTGKVDAVAMTNGDMLITGAGGAPSKAILINDYSNGNDMVVAKGIRDVAGLSGKTVGVEVGYVGHLLLSKALESEGVEDVRVVDLPTDQTPQALKQPDIAAIAAWQPHSGLALKEVGETHAVFTSAKVPGLIYDLLCVSPKSLAKRRADWIKVAQVWFRIVDFLRSEATQDEAVEIMAARAKVSPEEYRQLLKGTRFLSLAENRERFVDGEGLDSLHGSSRIVDAFQVRHEIYTKAQTIEDYIDGGVVAEVSKRG